MVGATVTTLVIGGGVMALPTVVLGLLAAAVAYGRRPRELPPRQHPLHPATRALISRTIERVSPHRASGSVG